MFQIPTLLLTLSLTPFSTAQFIYPPPVPSDKTLSDYTSGAASPITSYIIHDAIIGSYTTAKSAFSITRCAHAGRRDPILPSNGVFNSSEGRIAEDGTWQWMDSYSNGMFPNIYNSGNNLWIIADFEIYVGNDTTGHVCWWELYSVSEEQVYGDPNENGVMEPTRVVTLDGNDTSNYFASMPFVVNTTMREGNRNYTWRSSGGSDNRASSTTITVGNKPTGNAAAGVVYKEKGSSGLLVAGVAALGLLLGGGMMMLET